MGTVVSQKLAKQLPKRRKYKNVLSLKVKKKRSKKFSKRKKGGTLTLPVIPPKSVIILLKSRNKKIYDRKIIDYKNRSLLQEYIYFTGKIIPRRKTGITTKQQRYLTKAIKTARILGLLPFVKKEKGFFR
uniref:Small ribosomal subunit protein bS18c n=2 Tax=Uronema TaxID=104535 RepID=A0A6H1U5J3_9CHLO|nr:ribosomal protein S18 [Uronema confervicola]QIZ74168.1 ribosomal protein S18 [Uronema confervicola]QIZ74297.1 ribosomal protein S18 [Uronema sp. FACHB-2429]